MLGTLDGDKKTDWPRYAAPLVYTYNSTKYGSTGYSPYYFMFGRHPQLPVDVALGFNNWRRRLNHTLFMQMTFEPNWPTPTI